MANIVHFSLRVSQHLQPVWNEYTKLFPEDNVIFYASINDMQDKYKFDGDKSIVKYSDGQEKTIKALIKWADIIFWTPTAKDETVAKLLFESKKNKYILTENINKTNNTTFINFLKWLHAYQLLYNDLEIRLKLNYYIEGDTYLAQSSNFARDLKMLHLKRPVINFGYFPYYQYWDCINNERKNIASITSEASFKNNNISVFFAEYVKNIIPNIKIHFFGIEQNHGKTFIVCHGFKKRETILNQLTKMDMFIFPSSHGEGFGVSLLEAMSCGCVVFASKKAGATKFVVKDGFNGFVFNTKNELKRKVKKYLKMSVEDKYKLRKNAVKTIKNNWDPVIAATRINNFIKNKETNKEGPLSKGNKYYR